MKRGFAALKTRNPPLPSTSFRPPNQVKGRLSAQLDPESRIDDPQLVTHSWIPDLAHGLARDDGCVGSPQPVYPELFEGQLVLP
jgi:hypothetical protein